MKTIIGNEKATKYLKESVISDQLCHAYLLAGPGSVGKTKAAMEMARILLCSESGSESCQCHSCIKVAKEAHPDLHIIDGKASGIDEVRELVHSLDLAPYQSKYRVGVIAHAQQLTVPALNSFLKTLEEPGKNTVLILTAENPKTLLPTIVSRTRKINFGTVSDYEIFEYLNKELGIKREVSENIVSVVSGRIGQAITLAKEDYDISNEIKEAENFLRVYRSDNIADKISLAGKISTDKDTLLLKLSYYSAVFRKILIADTNTGKKNALDSVLSILDNIAKAEKMISSNFNTKLVVESLLLRSL